MTANPTVCAIYTHKYVTEMKCGTKVRDTVKLINLHIKYINELQPTLTRDVQRAFDHLKPNKWL